MPQVDYEAMWTRLQRESARQPDLSKGFTLVEWGEKFGKARETVRSWMIKQVKAGHFIEDKDVRIATGGRVYQVAVYRQTRKKGA